MVEFQKIVVGGVIHAVDELRRDAISGVPLLYFKVDVHTTRHTGEPVVDLFHCCVWRHQAERAAQTMKIGDDVIVIGTVYAAPSTNIEGNPSARMCINVEQIKYSREALWR